MCLEAAPRWMYWDAGGDRVLHFRTFWVLDVFDCCVTFCTASSSTLDVLRCRRGLGALITTYQLILFTVSGRWHTPQFLIEHSNILMFKKNFIIRHNLTCNKKMRHNKIRIPSNLGSDFKIFAWNTLNAINQFSPTAALIKKRQMDSWGSHRHTQINVLCM